MKDSREPWKRNRWPLTELRMSRGDCVQWMTKHKFPEPPRSACIFCPYHSNAEWRRLKQHEPVAFERAVAEVKAVADGKAQAGKGEHLKSKLFLHRSCIPLNQVDFSSEEERGQINLFENECEGICNT